MSEPMRLVLIDDHSLCRRGLSELLEQRAGMRVVATTGKPDEALEMVKTQAPDLVVMDLRMLPIDGLSLLARLRDDGCEVPVLILSMSDSRDDLAAALRLGVRGYLLKDMEPEEIVDAIRRAARGELVVAPAMALKLAGILQGGPREQPQPGVLASLTAREREILEHVARGLSNKAIARTLGISHDTVKLHVRHILAKLNLGSRVEAAVLAVEQKAVAEGELRRAPGGPSPAAGAAGPEPSARTTPATLAVAPLRQR